MTAVERKECRRAFLRFRREFIKDGFKVKYNRIEWWFWRRAWNEARGANQ